MNNPRPARANLVCSAVRGWEARVGSTSGQTRLASLHLTGCAECREFFAEDPGFEETLRRDATRLRSVSPDAGLERRILRAVREAAPETRRRSSRDVSPIWGRALLASASVAVAVVLWSLPQAPAPDSAVIAAAKKVTVAAQPRVAAAGGEGWKALEARRPDFGWAQKNPLEREIDSVRTDARVVIGFLALNFLPSKRPPEAPGSQG